MDAWWRQGFKANCLPVFEAGIDVILLYEIWSNTARIIYIMAVFERHWLVVQPVFEPGSYRLALIYPS